MSTVTRTVTEKMRYINPNPPEGAGLIVGDQGATAKQYAQSRRLMTTEHDVVFHDAREAEGGLGYWGFDKHGLACITPPPPMDFDDEEKVVREYYPKIAALAKEVSGAADVFVNSHLCREPNPKFLFQNPSRFAHTDASKHTPPSWRKQLQKKHGCSEAYVQSHDLCMVNIWHPRDIPAYKDPLCILDNTSVDLDRDVAIIPYVNADGEVDQKATSKAGNLVGPSFNPSHRWLYIPDQKPTEAWIFKQYDEREGVAKQCFHNSFHDPHYDSDPSIPGRRSVEFRMFLAFPKKKDVMNLAAKL